MCRKMICLVSFVLVLALVLTNFAQADLIGYWRFDESSGTTAADSAGGDNDGTLIGDDLLWTAGRSGGALSFPGVPDDARVEFPTTGMSATAGTVAMWGLLADPQPAQNKYFFGHTTQPQWANRVQLYMNDGDNLLDIGLGNSHTLDTDIMELPMEEWVHVALTWDSGNYVVYVNGEEVSSGAYAGLSEIHPIANIGNNGTSGPDKGFAGLLDEVRLYDHALNAAEILAAMEGVEQVDITAPGDIVQGVPNDGDWPTAYYRPETPEMAIDDNIETKYLHFKGDFDPDPGTGGAGFQVTPSAGPTIVTGLTLTTADDFPGRDPIAFELSGSNVGIDGPYELIASGDIVDFAQALAWPRFTMNITPISFKNYTAYAHYQLIFTAIRGPVGGSVNSMSIAEVELLGLPAPVPVSANIILVTENIDRDWDGLRDDHSLESFLISEGHSVDVRPEYWNVLTPDKITELNAADLIIVSRLAWSSRYNQGNETTEWNSLTTPLLLMNSHFARNIRWKWVNSDAREPDDTSYIYAGAVDQHHPIFQGVPMTLYDPTLRGGPLNAVRMIDPLVGTGFTAFIDGTDMGNGQLIAKPVGLEMGWIAEWDVGVEFFDGAGQYASGRRMLFCAGTREIRYYDDDRQEVITTAQGELNLTTEGLQMFRNAITYLLNIDPASITDGHVYLFENVGGDVPDDSANSHTANLIGSPQVVDGLKGKALQFNGISDGVHIPDAATVNLSTHQNRTVIAIFQCADVDKPEKQVVYEEGGTTRGLTIYVHEGLVYTGGWNLSDYTPEWTGTYLSAPISSNVWYAVAMVVRDGGAGQEDDKFEMWMDGELISKGPGAELRPHTDDCGIGYHNSQVKFHDGNVSSTGSYFEGIVDEIWMINAALTQVELSGFAGEVWPYAFGPTPADGAEYVYSNVELSWSPGEGAQLHIVYFSDNFDDMNTDAGGILLETTTYTPGPLELDKVYYWRVDEFDGVVIHKGDIWSFRTLPEIDPNLIGGWKFDEGSGTIAYDSSGNGNDGTLEDGPTVVKKVY